MNNQYISREIEKLLKKYLKTSPAIVLTGPRQSGKSTLLKNLFSKSHQFVSFDDPLLRERAIIDPKNFLDNLQKPFIIDEIQYVPEILSYLKVLIDKDRQNYGRFILTGSQQFNLMKNLSETLAGRVILFTLLPFSKKEKGSIKNFKSLTTQEYFIDACSRSSFPEISTYNKINFEIWFGSYLQTYLERDIRTIYEVSSLREFQRFMQLLARYCSQILNLSDFSRELGVSVNTIKKWISLLEASHIIYLLNPYYRNLGKRITKNPKVYFLDCGLVCYLTGIRDKRHLLEGPMAGAIWENYIIQETIKVYYNNGILPNISYLRTQNDLEIDLIIENNLKLFPVEIKLSKSPNINMANSIERFKNVFNKLDISFGQIISLSEEEFLLKEDIYVKNINNYLQWLKNNIS